MLTVPQVPVFQDSARPIRRGLEGRVRAALMAAVFLSAVLAADRAPAQTLAKTPDPLETRDKDQSRSGEPRAEKLTGPTLKLFKAVEVNDIPGVKSSIDAGADLFAQNEEGMTAADLAVDKGHFIVAHYLLSRRLAGETPPVALIPGKADKAQAAVKARPKRKFASPRTKPARPERQARAAKPPEPPSAAGTGIPETVAEAPQDGAPPEATPKITLESPALEETVAEVSAETPLAEKGISQFFKSLVELITPGGEKPPEPPQAEDETPPETGLPDEQVAEAPPGPPAEGEDGLGTPTDESIVEMVIDRPGETAEETIIEGEVEGTPAALEETAPETMTADVEPEEKPEKKEPPKPKEKEENFLDKVAGLFTSDKKEAEGEDTAGKAPGAPSKPPAQDITEYELPLPPPRPQAPKKFSLKFMDKLAEFLETGDEKEFKAWLPQMQVMNPGARPETKPLEVPPGGAAKQDPEEPPVPEKALKPEVKEVQLAESPVPAEEKPAKDAEAEAAEEKPGLIKGAFDKLVGVLTPDLGSKDRSGRVVLDAEETLAQLDKKEGAAGEGPGPDKADSYWPVTGLETAEKPKLVVKKPRKEPLPETVLKGVTLSLGQSVSLENSYPPMGNGIDPHNRCVKKNRGTTLFCLEAVDWPEKMQADFLVPTILYTGQKAIARYDQGIASRFHALFPTESFARVAAYFHERFGKPTNVWNRSIAPFAQPRQDNPTLAWQSLDPETQVVTVLEIRKYDDSRGGFPDTKRGAVMLYLANTPPIFPQVSSHELMRLSRSRMAPPSASPEMPSGAPGEAAAPAAAPGPGAEDGAPKKSFKDMTSEEIQAERRKRKALEAAQKAAGEASAPAGKPSEEDFGLPPDPKGR